MDDKHSWFSEEDKKQLLQVMQNVRNQLKRTNTARPSIEAQHQEPVTTVSDVKVAKPVSAAQSDLAASIQEVQTETSKEKEKSETEQECSLFLSQSEFNFSNSFDELICLKPVQPSSLVSVSQVAKEDSAEKEPEQLTQREDLEQQNSLQIFFDDILVYNTFFDKPAAQLKLKITDSEYGGIILFCALETFWSTILSLT
ncbi:hypothetical protein Bca101_010168 [Brassica carinata]